MHVRIHTHTSGAVLTAQQPLVNLIRTTLHALGAALAGTQAMEVSAYDEALAIPTEDAATLALRVQQVIQEETNVTAVTDPLGRLLLRGGAHRPARQGRAGARRSEIEAQGGYIQAQRNGWIRTVVEDSAERWRELVDSGRATRRRAELLRRGGGAEPRGLHGRPRGGADRRSSGSSELRGPPRPGRLRGAPWRPRRGRRASSPTRTSPSSATTTLMAAAIDGGPRRGHHRRDDGRAASGTSAGGRRMSPEPMDAYRQDEQDQGPADQAHPGLPRPRRAIPGARVPRRRVRGGLHQLPASPTTSSPPRCRKTST